LTICHGDGSPTGTRPSGRAAEHQRKDNLSSGNGRTAAGGAPRAADFRALGLHDRLLRAVDEMGFTTPTPVQAAAIPEALKGRDVLGCAMTGSGKTAAVLLPIVQRRMKGRKGRTRALVLSPTRELAAQWHAQLEQFAKHTDIRGAAIFGGVGMQPQANALR